jgi:hypothetical protein
MFSFNLMAILLFVYIAIGKVTGYKVIREWVGLMK